MKLKAAPYVDMMYRKYPNELEHIVCLKQEKFKKCIETNFDLILFTNSNRIREDLCKKYGVYMIPIHPKEQNEKEGISYLINQDNRINFFKEGQKIEKISFDEWTQNFTGLTDYIALRITLGIISPFN